MNTEQIAKISRGTCMAPKGQLTSHHLDSIHPTYVSLALPGSLSQESYILSLGAFLTSLYLWYPPCHTCYCKHASTILALHMMIK